MKQRTVESNGESNRYVDCPENDRRDSDERGHVIGIDWYAVDFWATAGGDTYRVPDCRTAGGGANAIENGTGSENAIDFEKT